MVLQYVNTTKIRIILSFSLREGQEARAHRVHGLISTLGQALPVGFLQSPVSRIDQTHDIIIDCLSSETQENLSVAPPAEPRGEKKTFFCANFGRWKTFKIWWKMGGEKFLVGLRGAKNFSIAFRIVFRILFRVFQTVFRIDLKIFRGQIRSARVPP